jgi:tripartite-type tricarboxylate transporter receptor subunit TctC
MPVLSLPHGPTRRVAMLATATLALALVAPSVSAQPPASFPTRPVKLVVPFPPGGAADTFARFLGDRLGQAWGQSVIVDNRPGAGGIVATQYVANSPKDGYTLEIVTVGHAVNPHLYAKLPYDTEKDLVPVARVATLPNMLMVNNAVPARSVKELIALARKKPGQLTYASAGNATTSHVAAAMFTSMAKLDMVHVPYKGSAPAFTDLLGGQVNVFIDPIVPAAESVKSGKLRALAVTTAKRSPLMPDLPTMAEAGVPGYEFSAWFILLAPAGTPPAVVQKINADVEHLMSLPDTKAKFTELGAEVGHGTPEELRAFIASEVARYGKIVRDTGMHVE